MTPDAQVSADGVWHNIVVVPALVEPRPPAPLSQPALVVQDGMIAWLGETRSLPGAYAQMPRHDGGGALLTPGLVDCHTHLVYAGNRAQEFAQRLAGASYEDIARAGGGIVSTVRATRDGRRRHAVRAGVAAPRSADGGRRVRDRDQVGLRTRPCD